MEQQIEKAVVNNQVLAGINMAGLNVPTNVVLDKKSKPAKPIDQLKALEADRIDWETVELAESNNRLYGILKQAYQYYWTMKKAKDDSKRKSMADDLAKFIKERGYVFGSTTHDMSRVVKCVFGVDRRRVSAYSIALREALRLETEVEDLVSFLEDNGGVEQIRLGYAKPLSLTKRAESVKGEVVANDIGKIKFNARDFAADPDWQDKQVVIIATYLPTGEFQANAVLRHDGAVNAALAAYLSNKNAAERAAKKAEKDAA